MIRHNPLLPDDVAYADWGDLDHYNFFCDCGTVPGYYLDALIPHDETNPCSFEQEAIFEARLLGYKVSCYPKFWAVPVSEI